VVTFATKTAIHHPLQNKNQNIQTQKNKYMFVHIGPTQLSITNTWQHFVFTSRFFEAPPTPINLKKKKD
jgi:hypothetical protein